MILIGLFETEVYICLLGLGLVLLGFCSAYGSVWLVVLGGRCSVLVCCVDAVAYDGLGLWKWEVRGLPLTLDSCRGLI